MAMRQDDKKKKAVVLLSGGLDSATVLAWAARRGGFECHAMSFKYGQRHGTAELAASRKLAAAWGAAEHRIVTIDLSAAGGFGHSALTDSIQVPKDRVDHGEIPVTYVPARNTIFLSFALGYAETIGSYDIFIGVNAIDYSGYPDCRPEFIETFQKLANLATAAGVEHKGRFTIHSPLVHMNKAEIIRAGLEMGVDYSMTHSCYDPDESGRACGHCDSCRIRLAGFAAAGAKDPVQYR